MTEEPPACTEVVAGGEARDGSHLQNGQTGELTSLRTDMPAKPVRTGARARMWVCGVVISPATVADRELLRKANHPMG